MDVLLTVFTIQMMMAILMMMWMVVMVMKLVTHFNNINTVALLLAWRLVMMATMVVVVTKLNGDGTGVGDVSGGSGSGTI